ncbi:D-2-hydroxyacid dehydrogenase [candidate division KSB1 bacterium]|nr:MAG: D-2-hydroxyacid dehydrogenase [candidate division KSB1 bacterium]
MITIVSFGSHNPERQVELKAGIEKLMTGKSHALLFPANEKALLDAARDAEIILTWRLTEAMFHAARRLKWVHIGNAGVEKSLFPAVAESDVLMTNARGIHGAYMAEWTLGALYYLAQRFSEAEAWRCDHEWKPRKDAMTQDRFLLEGKRALLIGYGSVGRAIAQKLAAVGILCEAIAAQPRPAEIPVHAVEYLEKLIGQFDIVIVAVPFTPQTRGLVSREVLCKMKPGAILVNLARGVAVDEATMIKRLRNGRLAAAALDVFTEEPLSQDSPLFDLPNVFMSPHISGNFPDYTKKVHAGFLRNLERYLNGQPLENVVDKVRGY